MPRYQFGKAEARAIYDYLGGIGAEQRTGVEPDRVRFAVAVPPGQTELGHRIKDAFDAAWRRLGQARPHGRFPDLRVVEVAGADQFGDASPFAFLLSVPDSSRRFFAEAARARIPVLLPFSQAEGTESPEDIRTAFTTVDDQITSLLEHVGNEVMIVVDAQGQQRLERVGLTARYNAVPIDEFVAGDAAAATIILLGGTSAAARLEQAGMRLEESTIYQLWIDAARRSNASLKATGAKIVVAVPYDARNWEGAKLSIDALAETAALLVQKGLVAAGRDLTRQRFLNSFGTLRLAPPSWPALDYTRHELGGTADTGYIPAQ
ncbi:MAG TPA: hypothetical protein VGN97_11015 [Mesorhizobium sp.]|jgi:hypothetical protein|nr:hypothetical protein [Mesorhizobium sp.]